MQHICKHSILQILKVRLLLGDATVIKKKKPGCDPVMNNEWETIFLDSFAASHIQCEMYSYLQTVHLCVFIDAVLCHIKFILCGNVHSVYGS